MLLPKGLLLLLFLTLETGAIDLFGLEPLQSDKAELSPGYDVTLVVSLNDTPFVFFGDKHTCMSVSLRLQYVYDSPSVICIK